MKEGEGILRKVGKIVFRYGAPVVLLPAAIVGGVACGTEAEEKSPVATQPATPESSPILTTTPKKTLTPTITPEASTVIPATQTATPEAPIPTATPEWFEHFPGPWPGGPAGMYVSPEAEDLRPKLDPTGTFYENELLVNLRDDLTKEEIAETLTQHGLDPRRVRLIKLKGWGGSFFVNVDPALLEKALEELKADPTRVDYAEKEFAP